MVKRISPLKQKAEAQSEFSNLNPTHDQASRQHLAQTQATDSLKRSNPERQPSPQPQVSMWLNLFFRVRQGTKDLCQASFCGVVSDLASAAGEQPDEAIRAKVQESIQLL